MSRFLVVGFDLGLRACSWMDGSTEEWMRLLISKSSLSRDLGSSVESPVLTGKGTVICPLVTIAMMRVECFQINKLFLHFYCPSKGRIAQTSFGASKIFLVTNVFV